MKADQNNKKASRPLQTGKGNKHPQNKDDPDSREGEEQIIKGNDITHNKEGQKKRK